MSDIITRDESGDLAVRTVTATEAESGSQYDDLYARTTDGKRALRVVGGGNADGGLPDQTGHTGFLQTDGTDATWSDKTALVNNSSNSSTSLAIGENATANTTAVSVGHEAHATGLRAVAIGTLANATSQRSISIGYNAMATSSYAIQLGTGTNNEANTFSVSLSSTDNYKLLNADGTIPAERLAANGTTGQVLTKSDSGMTWAEGGLPLSGGTLTGVLSIDVPNTAIVIKKGNTISSPLASWHSSGHLQIGAVTHTIYVGGNLLSAWYQSSLGDSQNKWNNIYVNKINNGADIAVPITGGTMVVATPPTAEGTYVLKATVAADGALTTEWVAE